VVREGGGRLCANGAGPFYFVVALYLLPVWAFPYLPTQDGPAHLANAIILKDYGLPGTRYHEFFELRREPLPNWTSQMLLAGLLHVLPALAAEKVLASLYVVAYAGSFRYFLGVCGRAVGPPAMAGLLFVYNHCFVMGFYNYCLSLALYWATVGYALRRREGFSPGSGIVLSLLLTFTYFTHLLGWLLVLVSVSWLLITSSIQCTRSLAWVAWAALPSITLAAWYVSREKNTLTGVLTMLSASGFLSNAMPDLTVISQQLFAGGGDWGGAIGSLVAIYLLALAGASFCVPQRPPSPAPEPLRWPVATLALALGTGYLVLPNDLGPLGGVLKPRLLVLVPPLLLASLPALSAPRLRLGLTVGLYLLLRLNLATVMSHFAAGNQEIRQFTAALDVVGRNRMLCLLTPVSRPGQPVNPLRHAAHYYCLGTGNICLNNYQARERYFPVRFRTGKAWRYEDVYDPSKGRAEVILDWEVGGGGPDRLAPPYREGFRQGCLRVLALAG
jgi:hypothetical protein